MNSRQTDNIRESIVIPLFEIIVYPKTRTKFLIDKTTCEMLLSEMKNIEPVYAIGLTVKSGLKFSDLSGASFYKIGNLLKITFVQPTNDGYLIAAEAVQRVEAISLHQENGQFYSEYEPISDIPDLDDEIQAEIIADVKKIILEISNRFQGSEQFTRPIDKMNSIDQIMGYIMPYMPIKLSEKQDLQEIISIRERYFAFHYILAKQKEDINLQIEVAQKVSEKINKSHREAMLREQLKVI